MQEYFKQQVTKDYGEEAGKEWGHLKSMPQINSSFLFFKRGMVTDIIFKTAKAVWDLEDVKYQKYRGAKPDEFCFNVACAVNHFYPHQEFYRPIWFQFVSETQSSEYILHYYKAFGFAGLARPRDWVIQFYNSFSRYYRKHFGIIPQFEVTIESTAIVDPNPIHIKIVRQRTLFRRGELPNSDGGIFNPDGIVLSDGSLMTIYRKEKHRDYLKGYLHDTAIPHVNILSKDKEENFELELPKDGARYEDFRIIKKWSKAILINCHRITGNLRETMVCESNVLMYNGNSLIDSRATKLPITTSRIEKNWVFISSQKGSYIIYGLNPYRIFQLGEEKELEVKQPAIKFFHDSFISNSTNPILVDGSYVMFFHTKANGIYYHGAVLIDPTTKEITHYTRNSIVLPHNGEGFQLGLLYVGGSVYLPETKVIRIFAGEGDAHSVYFDFDAKHFMNTLRSFPVNEDTENDRALEMIKQI